MNNIFSEFKPNIPDNEDYKLIWHDEFDGDELDRSIWNVELHEPGWVNEELQEYVDSPENIKVANSTLILQPVKKGDKYTSGRVNCQGKKDLLYGVFEVSAKVPVGKGYLPAFWLMAADENVYGQWPRCGEIDIMEVLGHDTETNYGTIHFGMLPTGC